MGVAAIDHARLMRVSGDRVEAAARDGTRRQQHLARRLIEDAGAWRIWEREHDGLMRKVASARGALGSRRVTREPQQETSRGRCLQRAKESPSRNGSSRRRRNFSSVASGAAPEDRDERSEHN